MNGGAALMMSNVEKASEDTAERFRKMAKAQFICQALNLDCLVVPSARLVEIEHQGKTYLFIAEERLNVDTDRSLQEECYRKYTCEMDTLVEQLISFVVHAEMSDISWRNLPLLNDNVGKIGLIDLDRMDTSVSLGLLGRGEEPERGLLNCLFAEKHIDAVVEAARPYDAQRADSMKLRRLKELDQETHL
jgi:hypothetical protein